MFIVVASISYQITYSSSVNLNSIICILEDNMHFIYT